MHFSESEIKFQTLFARIILSCRLLKLHHDHSRKSYVAQLELTTLLFSYFITTLENGINECLKYVSVGLVCYWLAFLLSHRKRHHFELIITPLHYLNQIIRVLYKVIIITLAMLFTDFDTRWKTDMVTTSTVYLKYWTVHIMHRKPEIFIRRCG